MLPHFLAQPANAVTVAASSSFKVSPHNPLKSEYAMKPKLVAFCLASLAGGVPALADVAFNNFGPGDSYHGNGWIIFGPQTSTQWTQGFQFVAAASGPVTNLVVPIQHLGGDNNFVFELFTDGGGVPGTRLGEVGQTAGFVNNSPPLPPPVQVPSNGSIVLTSGTTYWLVGSATGSTLGTWHANDQSQMGLRAYMAGGATTWTTGTVEITAFRVEVAGGGCYANCDGSSGTPLLTANDFSCYLNSYVNGESYADCDGVGGLTANDFQCFINRYVEGCS
jgi:hypothetical protein